MRNKSKLSILLIISLMCQMFAVKTFAAVNKIVADLGEKSRYEGIEKIVLEDGSSVNTVLTSRGGKAGYEIPVDNKAIYIDFKDEFLSKIDDGTEVWVEVEYYNQNDGHFMLLYDGLDGRTLADFIVVENTNQWKTHKFVLDDAYFGGRLDGYDMKISLKDTEMDTAVPTSVVIGKITVTKFPQKNPVRAVITSDEAGNIFSPADENIMKVKYHNFSEKSENVAVTLDVVGLDGGVVWSKTDELSIASKSDIEKEYYVDVKEFGLFNFRTTIKDEKGTFNSVTERAMSYVNTDTDGIRNEKFLINPHYSWMSYKDLGPEIVRKANAGGVRESCEWVGVEESLGVYQFEDRYPWMRNIYSDGAENSLWIAAYGNGRYNEYGDNHQIPYNDQYRNAYANYVAAAAKNFDGKIGRIELYNEPVLFGTRMNGITMQESAEDYAQLVEASYKAVQETGVDVKLGGMAHCGYQMENYKEWYRHAMDCGVWKWIDAITGHPYPQGPPMDETPAWVQMFIDHCKMVEDYGASLSDYEIWLTEMGLTLTDVDGDEEKQAKAHTRSYIYMDSIGYNDMYVAYDMAQDGIDPKNREHMFGILKHHLYSPGKVGLAANDAFVQIAQMNYMLADAEHRTTVHPDEDTDFYIYDSNKFGEKVGVLWTRAESHQVSLDLGCESVTVYDRYGNSDVVYGNNGIFTFPSDEFTYYVKGNFKKNEVVEQELVNVGKTTVNVAKGDVIEINYNSDVLSDIKVAIGRIADNIKIINSDWQTSGKIVMRLPENIGDHTYLKLNFLQGEKCVQTSEIRVNYAERLTGTIDVKLADTKNLNLWKGTISITNHSGEKTLNGYVKINSPENYNGIKKIPTGPIPAGKTAEIAVNYDNLIKKGIYNFGYDIVLNDGSMFEVKETKDLTVAKKTLQPPVIDGLAGNDEWNKQTYMHSEDTSQVKLSNWGGINDISGKTNIMWDDEYLYMLVVAQDNVHCNTNTNDSIWAGDSVQFGIVIAPELEVTVFGQRNLKFSELGMALTDDGVKTWRWSSEDDSHKIGAIENSECVVQRNGSQTVYELKIPWEQVVPAGYKVNSDRPLGFSMLINDNDGEGRRGWIEYASGIGTTKNTSLFTYLQLIE